MAERTMLVCDTCGRPAVETVSFKTSKGNRQRDYCPQHLAELLASSRAPKRGRRPGATSANARGTATAKKSTAKRTTKKSATGRTLAPKKAPSGRKGKRAKR